MIKRLTQQLTSDGGPEEIGIERDVSTVSVLMISYLAQMNGALPDVARAALSIVEKAGNAASAQADVRLARENVWNYLKSRGMEYDFES